MLIDRITTKAFDAANQVAGSATTQYDAAGNMIATPDPSDASSCLTCVYDAWNRLVLTTRGTTTVAYQYDATGRRTERIVGTAIQVYFYSGQQVAQIYSYDGAINSNDFQCGELYVWSPLYVGTPILRDTYSADGELDPRERLYYTTDANHNVTAIILGEAGYPCERYTYTAYGVVTQCNSSLVLNTRLFAGMDLDPTTGLYYDRARWYNPGAGTFVSRDPIESSPNCYAYCDNNPLIYTDPSGLVPIDDLPRDSDSDESRRGDGDGSNRLDWIQGVLDAAGIFDPTPLCDGISGFISVLRGNWDDASCSAIACAPYIGDLVGKGAKYGGRIIKGAEKAADVAKGIDKAKDAAKALSEMTAAERRAYYIKKGVSASEIGPSGYPKIHTIEHPSLKRAEDAGRSRVGKGGTTVKHPSPGKGDSHVHGVDRRGNKSRIHDEYPE